MLTCGRLQENSQYYSILRISQNILGNFIWLPISTSYLNLDRREVWSFHCNQWTQWFPLLSNLFSPSLPALWTALPSSQLLWLTLWQPWFPLASHPKSSPFFVCNLQNISPNWPLLTISTDTSLGPSHHHFLTESPEPRCDFCYIQTPPVLLFIPFLITIYIIY